MWKNMLLLLLMDLGKKRGQSSLNGVVTGASLEKGKVIDVECLKKYCQGH